MAEVFLIRRTGPGGFEKFLALKRIRAGLDVATYAPMLLNEARLVAALQHPNIVQVHDAGNDDNGLWFLMEYVHGRSVNTIIARAISRGVAVPLECAAYIAAGVGRALHYAHHAESATQGRLGVIHRDVSPGNILVGFDGVVKLADFGIARANLRQSETQDGTFKGKYGYAAPEQCRGEPLDGASDLFSLGIVLHELVAARHLFAADLPSEVIEAVQHRPIPRLTSLREGVPEEFDRIVQRMLARDRSVRIRSGADVANELDAMAHRFGMAATRERMAELMTKLFTAAEMRLEVPSHVLELDDQHEAPIAEGSMPYLRAEGTPRRSLQFDAIADPRDPASEAARSDAPLEDALGKTTLEISLASALANRGRAIRGGQQAEPRKAGMVRRILFAAAIGGISAIATALLVNSDPQVLPPTATAPAAPSERAEPMTPAGTTAGVDVAAPAPPVQSDPTAGSRGSRRNAIAPAATRQDSKRSSKPRGNRNTKPAPNRDTRTPAIPASDEPLLERDW